MSNHPRRRPAYGPHAKSKPYRVARDRVKIRKTIEKARRRRG